MHSTFAMPMKGKFTNLLVPGMHIIYPPELPPGRSLELPTSLNSLAKQSELLMIAYLHYVRMFLSNHAALEVIQAVACLRAN